MRRCGILLPVFSLPSPWGIGTLGKEAREFVDFLHQAGQHVWQILPIHPTGYGNSPYYTLSAFAGNPNLIDPAQLAEAGLLKKEELAGLFCRGPQNQVDYGWVEAGRRELLYRAFRRFDRTDGAFENFREKTGWWLVPYSRYLALRKKEGTVPWNRWQGAQPEEEAVEFHQVVQYFFFSQFAALRAYARGKQVAILGDVPFYVPHDSADVWQNRALFHLDREGAPRLVAGCPPDDLAPQGQRWGFPVYRWQEAEEAVTNWWCRRIAWGLELFDGLRLDHFRGFESFWAIPAGEPGADRGFWLPGPGEAFFRRIKERVPEGWLIAEDLGTVTPRVRQLLAATGFAGMKVLLFAFATDWRNEHLPHRYEGTHWVCYSSLHDTMTARQWLLEAPVRQQENFRTYVGRQRVRAWALASLCLESPAELAMIPLQDYLELGEEGRMNVPGTVGPHNWSWRAGPQALTDSLAEKIRALCRDTGR